MSTKLKFTPPVDACIFCGTPELTEEDLWPLWLSRKYDRPNQLSWTFTARANKRAPYPARNVRKLAKVLHIVCGTCNNRWMSRLENRAIPFLLPLMEASSRSYDFSDEALSALTAWMTKMAMVWEYAVETKPKFFSARRCAAFKADPAPPPDVAIGIWVGRRVRARTAIMTHASVRNVVTWSRPPAAAPERDGVANYLQTSTFCIDQLVFQVVAQRGRKAASVDFTNYDIPGVFYRLWPPPRAPQPWPPKYFLVEGHLRDIAQRIDGRTSL